MCWRKGLEFEQARNMANCKERIWKTDEGSWGMEGRFERVLMVESWDILWWKIWPSFSLAYEYNIFFVFLMRIFNFQLCSSMGVRILNLISAEVSQSSRFIPASYQNRIEYLGIFRNAPLQESHSKRHKGNGYTICWDVCDACMYYSFLFYFFSSLKMNYVIMLKAIQFEKD